MSMDITFEKIMAVFVVCCAAIYLIGEIFPDKDSAREGDAARERSNHYTLFMN